MWVAKYCDKCEMWLNGPEQLENHKIRTLHKKNVKKDAKGKRAQVAESEEEITTRLLQIPTWYIAIQLRQEACMADGQTESAMLELTYQQEKQEMKDAVEKYLYGLYTELPDKLDL